MTALAGGGVKANVSRPSGLGGVPGEILGSAAPQPQQAAGEKVADLA